MSTALSPRTQYGRSKPRLPKYALKPTEPAPFPMYFETYAATDRTCSTRLTQQNPSPQRDDSAACSMNERPNINAWKCTAPRFWSSGTATYRIRPSLRSHRRRNADHRGAAIRQSVTFSRNVNVANNASPLRFASIRRRRAVRARARESSRRCSFSPEENEHSPRDGSKL